MLFKYRVEGVEFLGAEVGETGFMPRIGEDEIVGVGGVGGEDFNFLFIRELGEDFGGEKLC